MVNPFDLVDLYRRWLRDWQDKRVVRRWLGYTVRPWWHWLIWIVLWAGVGFLLVRVANAQSASILCGYPPPAAPGCYFVCECAGNECHFVQVCP